MEDVVDPAGIKEIFRDVLLDEAEVLVAGKMRDVVGVAGDEIVERDDIVPLREEAVAQMRAEKPRAARHQSHRPFFRKISHKFIELPILLIPQEWCGAKS